MNIGRNDIDWRNLSHDEIDRIIAERIEADDRRIEASGGKKPKRVGYILERIAEINNLREADREAQDGKVKKNRFIRRHNLHPEEDLRALQLMILTLDFPAPDYSVMKVRSDAGKVRDIVKRLHRYCDDNVMLARSKAEALFLIRAYERESAKVGLVVKANSCIAPIGTETKNGNKKRRKRKRSKRKKD